MSFSPLFATPRLTSDTKTRLLPSIFLTSAVKPSISLCIPIWPFIFEGLIFFKSALLRKLPPHNLAENSASSRADVTTPPANPSDDRLAPDVLISRLSPNSNLEFIPTLEINVLVAKW